MYALAKLVIDTISENDESKLALMKEFGIKRIHASNTVIQALIHGDFDENIVRRLAKVIPIDRNKFLEAANETEQRIRQEAEALHPFCPHLWTLHDRWQPSMPIVILGLIGIEHFRLVLLPKNIVELPFDEQIRMIKEIIAEKYQKGGEMVFRYNKICYGTFGKITGYVYSHHRGEFILLDQDGNILKMEYHYNYPNAAASIKHKNFRFSIE